MAVLSQALLGHALLRALRLGDGAAAPEAAARLRRAREHARSGALTPLVDAVAVSAGLKLACYVMLCGAAQG